MQDSAAELKDSRRQHPGIVEHGMPAKSPKQLHRAVAGEQDAKTTRVMPNMKSLSLDM